MRSGERRYGIGVLAAVVLGAGGALAQTTTWSHPRNYTGVDVAAIDASGRRWVGTANRRPYRGDFATGVVEEIPVDNAYSTLGLGVDISGDGTAVVVELDGGHLHVLRSLYGTWQIRGNPHDYPFASYSDPWLSHDGREVFLRWRSQYQRNFSTGASLIRDGVFRSAPDRGYSSLSFVSTAGLTARMDRLCVWRGGSPQVAQMFVRDENRFVDLPRLAGETSVTVLGISPEGSVIVGVSRFAGRPSEMWMWREATGTQVLPPPASTSTVTVCAEGRVIYASSWVADLPGARAMVFENGLMQPLTDVLIAEGAVLPAGIGWSIVRDASDDGSVILLDLSHADAPAGDRLLVRRSALTSPIVTFVDSVPSREGCTIRVRFGANAGIEAGALDAGDIEIRTPWGELLPVGFVGATTLDANRVVGTYAFAAPGGQWDMGNAGEYQVWVRSGAVADVRGITTPLQLAGRFSYPFNSPIVSAEDAYAPDGGTTLQAVVLYEDPVGAPSGISWASVGSGDVVLSGPAGYAESGRLTSRATPGSGAVLAAYQFPSRGAYWDWTDSGAYTLALREGEVWDEQGNLAPGGVLGTYPLAFQIPWAGVAAVTARAGHSDLRVTMNYRANGRFMSWGSLGDGDVELLGPGGFVSTGQMVSRRYDWRANSYTVVYSLPARGGAWDSSDNGVYSLWFRDGEVWDSLGYAIPGVQMGSYPLRF